MGRKAGDKQQLILDYIKKEVSTRGYPPSVREIGEAVGLSSTSTVHGHLSRLEKRGLIRRDPSKPRAIELLTPTGKLIAPTVEVPLLGRVTAGAPILAQEDVEAVYLLPVEFASHAETFMLTVQGESMINAGILDGDYVIVRRQPSAENGDIVVALIEDEATVKRFYKENGHFRLQPENDYMEPIIVPQVEILGKVVGLIRRV